jgi:hypothetical protein
VTIPTPQLRVKGLVRVTKPKVSDPVLVPAVGGLAAGWVMALDAEAPRAEVYFRLGRDVQLLPADWERTSSVTAWVPVAAIYAERRGTPPLEEAR